MRTSRECIGAVCLILVAGAGVNAQLPADLPYLVSPNPVTPSGIAPSPTPTGPHIQPPLQALAPDNWIYQQDATCCGPMGGQGPIGSEVYVRSGPSFVLGSQDLGHSLRTGWEVMGGGRTLFFMPDGYRAWVVDLGLSYTYNDGVPERTFQFGGGDVTIRNLHRTAVSLGLGHDWFFYGPGSVGSFWDKNIRFGLDGGARWGTSHLDLNSTTTTSGFDRVQKIYGAAFAGLHLDMEVPMGGWTFLAGVRGEWSYSFMHLLPSQSTSLYDVNVLLTLGVRY